MLMLSLASLLALSVRAVAVVHAALHALSLLSDVLHVSLDLTHHAVSACLGTHCVVLLV